MKMSSPPPFTIRIRTEQDQDVDWMVQPDEITFHQALEVISQILPDSTTTAFQYDDEDGERITVRSNAELNAMFQMYFSFLSEDDIARGLLPPLVIYPRVGKTPQNRNIHGLKIKTAKPGQKGDRQTGQFQSQSQSHGQAQKPGSLFSQPSQPTQPTQPAAARQETSHQYSTTANLKEILACGENTEKDMQFLEMLGRGNGGEVKKALHIPSQKLMAVKVIPLDVDVEQQKKILSELDILYKCNFPAIIGFYGAFFAENRISICTEYMDGGSLDKYGEIPEPVLGRITVRIVQGLLYMWSLKILHRDLKPSNILVNTAGEVKLCDFGVSIQLVASIAQTYIGTNAYMSPERIQGQGYGSSSELWSLGVTVFELATGKFPYTGPIKLLDSIVKETPPILPEGMFSPELRDFVSRCMEKTPEFRIPHEQLLTHPWIQKYNDDGTCVVAAWVKSRLQLIQPQPS